jgi:glycosyltransferase involved in cell wall biosynthesis
MMKTKKIAILHYSAPPIVGGVESVILAHVRLLNTAGYQITVVVGEGDEAAFPQGTKLVKIPEISTRHPEIAQASRELEQGQVPDNFGELVTRLKARLEPVFQDVDQVMIHNVFTKHFNLPLTAALSELLDQDRLPGGIAWCHDFTWTSANSRSKVFPGYPWDLLRKPHPELRYVTISKFRQRELAELFNCPVDKLEVIYNGVNPEELLGLSESGLALIERLGLWSADLILLMPVRVTQAKNIELAIHLAAALKERGVHPKIILTGPPDPHDLDNLAYFQSLLTLRQELKVEQEMCFVYTSGPEAGQPYVVEMELVGDLYRVSDALFMPSHREGFGMPILEAGLAGLSVFCSAIPAADELGGNDVTIFEAKADSRDVAALILNRMEKNASWKLRRRVRQSLTWQGLFQKKILPLLGKGSS